MQPLQHQAQTLSSGLIGGRMPHKMVAVREKRPGLELPAAILCDSEQAAMQHAYAFRHGNDAP
jgi:hypothetical protein